MVADLQGMLAIAKSGKKKKLTSSMLGKNSSRGHFEIFSYFPRKLKLRFQQQVLHAMSNPIFQEK